MTLPLHDLQTPMGCEPDIEVRLRDPEDGLDWETLFGNSNPVEIELGCGKGRFIIGHARENQGLNCFGIEKSSKFFRILKQRVSQSGLKNIRLLNAEAGHFLRKYIPDGSVHAYHIFFPDPWPKKRHHKRRLVNPRFIESVKTSLHQNGKVFFATDFADYFNHIVDIAGACKGLQELFCNVIRPSECNPEEATTNYERKYLLQGRPIYKASYIKV